MSSIWSSPLGSLDDSLALFSESLEKLGAAQSVDIAEVIEQFKRAAESAQNIAALVSVRLPEASWQTREELDALIEEDIQRTLKAEALERQRSRLLALAAELEHGAVVHRRAIRVNEVNQLREQAINELRSLAALDGTLPSLPGPEADQWIAWACALQEPQDIETLQTLQNGFAHLFDFVANLEPDMWVVQTTPKVLGQSQEEREEIRKRAAALALEQRRSRLLGLADELERGNIVHRRALRVTELNQLREPAINELRFQAGPQGMPPALPGPEADQWIEWASGLREPEDSEALQILRNGFAQLYEFVANLEPGMWVAAGAPALHPVPQEPSDDKTLPEESPLEKAVGMPPVRTRKARLLRWLDLGAKAEKSTLP